MGDTGVMENEQSICLMWYVQSQILLGTRIDVTQKYKDDDEVKVSALQAVANWRDNYLPYEEAMSAIKNSSKPTVTTTPLPDIVLHQGPWKTETPISYATFKAGAQPTPSPPQPEQPNPTKSVQIFFAHSYDKHASGGTKKDSFFWHIFQGKAGKGVDPCKKPVINTGDNFVFYEFDPAKDSNPGILPNGDFQAKIDGQQCTYKGLGEERPDKDVGWLHCPGRGAVKCLKDYRFSEDYKIECDRSGIPQYYHAVAFCDW